MREIERDDVVEMAAQAQCAVCKHAYGRQGVHVLGRRDDAWIIAVTCPYCDAEGLMIATVEEADRGPAIVDEETEPRPKMMYDVSYDEWLAFEEQPAISRDDVLDTHLFLKQFDGDFNTLFGGKDDTQDNVK